MNDKVRFSHSAAGGDRVFHISEEDVRVVLGRLPQEAYSRLRAVHFNDQSRGGWKLGYADSGRREIALCALPPRMSLARFLVKGESPRYWGAQRGSQWPSTAIRRYLLYDVFLHELGHLQVIDSKAKSPRRKYAMETKAEEFAAFWRGRLWSQPFEHADPCHHPPGPDEKGELD